MTGKKTREIGPILYGAGAPEAFPLPGARPCVPSEEGMHGMPGANRPHGPVCGM